MSFATSVNFPYAFLVSLFRATCRANLLNLDAPIVMSGLKITNYDISLSFYKLSYNSLLTWSKCFPQEPLHNLCYSLRISR
jgi:hypothetical protein